MSIDQDIQTYINELKNKYYLDANIQKDGVNILSEMIALTKQLIDVRKRQLEKQQGVLSKRFARVSSIIDEIGTLSNNIALTEKYDIFRKNIQDLYGISSTMDDTVAKINFSVANSIRKIRTYRREYNELLFKITDTSDLIEFYENAEIELAQIESHF